MATSDNTLATALQGLKALPYVLAGIQAIHGDAIAGADKKKLALESLGLAVATAENLLPGEATLIEAASTVTSGLIDSFVNLFKLGGLFGFSHKPKTTAVTPVTPVTTPPVPTA